MNAPEHFSRQIDYAYYKRAKSVSSADAPNYLDSIAVDLHRALDNWRYNDGGTEDVAMCLDAFSALWSVVEDAHVG